MAATNGGLTPECVSEIVSRYAAGEKSGALAREFGVTPSALSYHFRKRGVPLPASPRSEMDCRHCGKHFSYITRHAIRAPRRYCSVACRAAGYRHEEHYKWSDMPTTRGNGYVFVRVPAGHVSRLTNRRKNKARAPEHVLIAEAALGRPLKKGEVVHHINCDKTDNRNANLMICTRSYHAWLHGEMSRCWARGVV